MRRSWSTEAVAWSATFVLVAGIGVASTGVVDERRAAEATRSTFSDDGKPAVTTPAAGPQTYKREAPRQVKAITKGSSAALAAPRTVNFGPPPGPKNDIVPERFAAAKDRYAFLTGVTDYRPPTKDTLAGAADVVFIRNYLLSAGWLPQNIRVATDRRATGAAMREGLKWLAAKSQPGTFTLFHYSGHVKQVGGHEKLWPWDRKFVPDTDVAAILKRGKGKMWVDIAGCEAGGFVEDLPSSRVLVSASSTRTQKSYEHPQWRQSIWVGLMWDAGMNQGQADANGNKVTTIGEALRFASYWAQAVTYTQRPYGRQSPLYRGMRELGWTLADPPA